MPLTRRKMIGLVGGGFVLAATGATVFATTRRPDAALAPWDVAGHYDDPRMAALSWAILAPNPHNRQPWLAELIGDDEVAIWRDKALNLPETDPFDRQLTIGMGCFLEIFRQAAAQQGLIAEQTLFPEGEDGPVARISLAAGGKPEPLFQHVSARHTNRKAYEDRIPEASELSAIAGEASAIVVEPDEVAALRKLTWKAMEIEMATERTHMESVELMRLGKHEIEAKPDGISLGGPFLEAMMAFGQLTREGLADPESSEYRQTIDFLKSSMDATPAYAVLTTPGNSRLDQVDAGRRWVRLHLAATGQGLAMQPLSQALQEYPEQSDLYAEIHQRLARTGETVQMLGRVGYGPSIDASPRWPLESRMLYA